MSPMEWIQSYFDIIKLYEPVMIHMNESLKNHTVTLEQIIFYERTQLEFSRKIDAIPESIMTFITHIYEDEFMRVKNILDENEDLIFVFYLSGGE